jgi:hypothetical protein
MLYPKDPEVSVDRVADTLTLSWSRKRTEGALLLIMGVALVILAATAISMPLKSGEPRAFGDKVGIMVMMSLMGLPVIYVGLVSLLNRTAIRADRQRLVCTSGPVPFQKPFRIEARGLKQFFAISVASPKSGTYRTNTIYVMDADDRAWPITAGLPSLIAAHQICHALDDFYGLEDLPVYGVTTDPSHPGPRA